MDGAEIVIQLVFRLIFGIICAAIASSKGRNAVGWFFLGFFFACIPLIIILCLSNRNEEEARWAANDMEQRRLREQLRQEQMKNEALRQHTMARLDQHDDALGMDTRQTAPAPSLMMGSQMPGTQPANLPAPLAGGTPPPGLPADNWYTAEGGTQQGPFTFEFLHSRARQGGLDPDVLVWAEGMAEWQAARTVPGIFPS